MTFWNFLLEFLTYCYKVKGLFMFSKLENQHNITKKLFSPLHVLTVVQTALTRDYL